MILPGSARTSSHSEYRELEPTASTPAEFLKSSWPFGPTSEFSVRVMKTHSNCPNVPRWYRTMRL